ncbi:uncharacterized protein LDX57_004016 [Aspergillus melleus]|uniref:uncharacterized protein n=1 Tax=Aspergillus melleus TaxID=138277 RepID=UPI001E8D3992|nr:uncharacterized protein LDX57_004016 [Aspergillus melleus]KAH8426269.1 hypothetical protein LDX57_004016 [Aspergillus melleus]
MDYSDLIRPDAREVNASSPTHRSSSPHSSRNEPRRMPSFGSQKHAPAAPDQGPLQAVNESTPIVRSSDSTRRNYHSTDGLRNRDSGSGDATGKNSAQRDARDADQQAQPTESAEPKASWYSQFADRYGSLELENKGSVARDHLALGAPFLILTPLIRSHSFLINHFMTGRTDIPCLAENITGFRIYWHSGDPVVPPEQLY